MVVDTRCLGGVAVGAQVALLGGDHHEDLPLQSVLRDASKVRGTRPVALPIFFALARLAFEDDF